MRQRWRCWIDGEEDKEEIVAITPGHAAEKFAEARFDAADPFYYLNVCVENVAVSAPIMQFCVDVEARPEFVARAVKP